MICEMRNYFLFTAFLLLVAPYPLHVTAQNNAKDGQEFYVACIAFYNVENLFDTINDPDKQDDDFTPEGTYRWNTEKYNEKLENLAEVIASIGTEITPDGPAVLGLAEVENRAVLEDLAAMPAIKDRNYQIVHYESPDFRGIDVAFFYQPKYFSVTHSTVYPLRMNTEEEIKSREHLVVSGIFDGEPMHFIVAHWPSRRGGERRSRPLRIEAAKVVRHVIDSIKGIEPDAKIVFMGDLNDDPNNVSVKKYLNAHGNKDRLEEGQLYNTMYDLFRRGVGSLAWRDSWNLFDQIIITQPFLNAPANTYRFHSAKVYNKPYITSQDGPFKGYPFRSYSFGQYVGGYSDHFPTYIFVVKEK